MTFWRGQKVVCVDASIKCGRIWDGDIPQPGGVYTVEDIVEEMDPLSPDDNVGIVLVEIKNHKVWGYSYRASRFRPATERKTDIGFAHEILRKVSDFAPIIARNRSRIQAIAHPEKST